MGNEFVLDVFVDVRIDAAAEEDDLFQTLNYETLFCFARQRYANPPN
ncbi:MAG: hypothetical protein IPN33_17605 [Saprospiraceae bacterium]|nr:hypothetical protein [Saprospiraceae bacterium]